ncbi:TonB-dependent siderophore receptor [Acinetobacter sp. MD2(2019)]|uniref:TonB-dependent siderophore receptor n=1 Tax=Acinetobacter sp. MD2(2019) TaxID=2605273 RepID=UPI002D1F29FD|nr:TonB-dependent siderophore receptor [Acinetobacter sp. MD2(2019)]MEB3754035.1 TonB-dependent siderophore receptor [Acinetobacter sp. MD2(2019)]
MKNHTTDKRLPKKQPSLLWYKRNPNYLLSIVSLVLITGTAHAAVEEQNASDTSVLPTIKVSTEKPKTYTTQKTSSSTGLALSPKETPQSVSVITRQQLDDTNAQTIDDVMGQATGITFNQLDVGGRTTYRARGYDITNYKSDGLAISGESDFDGAGNSLNMDLYEQVSIVRGANGLLGGTGDPSATIDLVRKLPKKELGGSVKLRTGSWDKKSVVGDINVPLTQEGSVRSRLVVSSEDSDSFRERENFKRTSVLASIAADVSDDTTIGAGFQYDNKKEHGVSWGTNVPVWFADATTTNFSRKFNPTADWSRSEYEGITFFTSLDSQLANDWKLSTHYAHTESEALNNLGVVKVNNRSIKKKDANGNDIIGNNGKPLTGNEYPHWNQDGTGAYLNALHSESETKNDVLDISLSGPFQLFGRQHDLMLGMTGSQTQDKEWAFNCNIDGVTSSGPTSCQYRTNLSTNWRTWSGDEYSDIIATRTGANKQTTTNLYGGYLAARFSLMDDLSLITGVRRSYYNTYINSYTENGTLSGQSGQKSTHAWTPYYGLVYNFAENYSAYASYTDIFTPQSQQKQNGDVLNPITGQSYEVGIKGAWFDDTLNASLAVFKTKQKNLAIKDSDNLVQGVAGTQAYFEGTGRETQGFETEISGAVTDNWNVSAGYTYLSVKDQSTADRKDPRNLFRIHTTYNLSDYINGLTIGAGASWQTPTINTPNPGRPILDASGNPVLKDGIPTYDNTPLKVKGYTLFDAMARYDINKNFSASLNVSNLFDKTYYRQYGFYNGLIYGEPRRFTLSLEAKF